MSDKRSKHVLHANILVCIRILSSHAGWCVQASHTFTPSPLPSPSHTCVSCVFSLSTRYSSSWLCCVIRTVSAEVTHPLQARQSLRVILAFFKAVSWPSYVHACVCVCICMGVWVGQQECDNGCGEEGRRQLHVIHSLMVVKEV